MWGILPIDAHCRLPSIGHSDRGGPEWTISEEDDGTVTVDPSIQMLPVEGYAPGWHGYLERGVWREV
jgi:hypothetical protein